MATSGMLEGGPSVEYFKELAPDPKNKIMFVSCTKLMAHLAGASLMRLCLKLA